MHNLYSKAKNLANQKVSFNDSESLDTYSNLKELSLTSLEKDRVIVAGFGQELKLVEDTLKYRREEDDQFVEAYNKLMVVLKKSDKTYSELTESDSVTPSYSNQSLELLNSLF